MLSNQDSIFNIPYSLPSNTHSIAIATRRPTTGFNQSLKYMPDYGGILEIPGGHFKRNGLASGYPFFPKPYYIRLVSNESEQQQKGPSTVDCLAISSYLTTSQEPTRFTTIRAIGPKLYFDSAEQIFCDGGDLIEGDFESTTYAHVPYPYDISGIKYCEELDDLLMVKFSRGLKLLRLNKSYQLPQFQPEDELNVSFPDQSAIQFIESFPEKKGYTFSDACISQHSRGLVALASSGDESLQVRFFDITRSKSPYNTIQRSLIDDSLGEMGPVNRRQSLRSFVPAKTSSEIIQQLDCDTSHLFNILLTTTHKIALIDPRLEGFGNTIVDKSLLGSLMPSEIFVKTNLSRDCDHQIYCMSNMNLRIFDKRFPSNPITTIAHMLEPLSHESMNMKLIDIKEGVETLCMSSSGRLAMVTFDRARASTEGDPVITPRSTHSPVHEPSPAELSRRFSDELIGLATTTSGLSEKGILFTAAQLSQEGDVCIRAYTPYNNQDFSRRSQANVIISQNKSCDFKSKSRIENSDLEDRIFSNTQEHINDDREYIDLNATDDVSALGRELTSTRASKKFENMRYKLRRR